MPVSPALLPSAQATEPLKRPVGAAARADRAQSAGFAQTLAEAQSLQSAQPGSSALSEAEVRPGDTLSGIVARHLQLTQPGRSASPTELYQLAVGVARDNGIADPNLILPGQVIDVSSLDAAPGPARQAAVQPSYGRAHSASQASAPMAAPAAQALVKPQAVSVLPASAAGSASAFLVRHAEAAQRVQATSGIPATYMLSQAALETGWGRQEIRAPDGRNSFNLFGIRAGSNWQGPTVQVWTTEHINGSTQRMVGEFRAYSSYEESFADYARLISQQPRYAQVMQNLGDPNAFASAMQRSGYATGPRYASALASVIETTHRLQGTVPEVQAALSSPAQPQLALAQASDPLMPPAAQVLQLRFNSIAPMAASAQAANAARMARQRAYASLDLPLMP